MEINKKNLETVQSGSREAVFMIKYPDAILPRKDAIAQGLGVYRTGKACKHGHKSYRYTSTSSCIACLKGEPGRYTPDSDPGDQHYELQSFMDARGLKTVSRTVAVNHQLNKYFTGEPCASGHIAPRYVNGRACVECRKNRKERRGLKPVKTLKQQNAALTDYIRRMLRDVYKQTDEQIENIIKELIENGN